MTSTDPADKFRAFLLAHKIAKSKVDAIVTEFESYLPGDVRAVLPTAARAAVETIEAHGLRIDVDANGRAARVALAGEGDMASTTDGFDVEYW